METCSGRVKQSEECPKGKTNDFPLRTGFSEAAGQSEAYTVPLDITTTCHQCQRCRRALCWLSRLLTTLQMDHEMK